MDSVGLWIFLFLLGKKASKTLLMLQTDYKDDAMIKTQVKELFSRLKKIKCSSITNLVLGELQLLERPKNVEKVRAIVLEDRRSNFTVSYPHLWETGDWFFQHVNAPATQHYHFSRSWLKTVWLLSPTPPTHLTLNHATFFFFPLMQSDINKHRFYTTWKRWRKKNDANTCSHIHRRVSTICFQQ